MEHDRQSGCGWQAKNEKAWSRRESDDLGLLSLLESPPSTVGGGCPRPVGGSPAAGGGGRLEQVSLNGTSLGESLASVTEGVVESLLVTGCRCRSWACPECGVAYWGRFRARTIGAGMGRIFKRAALFSLTLDRKHFIKKAGEAGIPEAKAPEFAYEYVESGGYIRLLLRLLGVKKGIKVMAFHPLNKEWVHWHVVIDLGDLPGKRLDLERAWALWRDRWKLGGLDLQANKRYGSGACGAESAVGYAIGYCQHQSGVVGSWVYGRERLPRSYELLGECREWDRKAREEKRLADLGDDGEESLECVAPPVEPAVIEPAGRVAVKRTTVGERMKRCGQGFQLIRELVYPDGSKFYKWVGGSDDVSLVELVCMAKAGRLLGARFESVTYGTVERLRLVVDGPTCISTDWVADAVNAVRSAAIAGDRRAAWGGDGASEEELAAYDSLLERDIEAIGESFTGEGVEFASDGYAPF